MRHFIILLTTMVVILSACNKDEQQHPETPQWLKDKIVVMQSDPLYYGTKVILYQWNKEYYYLIESPLSSCLFCEFYTYKGVIYAFDNESIDDFGKNAKKIKVVWERQNSY